MNEDKIDLSQTDILVVDDINLIKKLHQLKNLETVLAALPADKQNIVFTNRRSKETQSILDQILKTPAEIKVDKDKEAEAEQTESDTENAPTAEIASNRAEAKKKRDFSAKDGEALSLMKKYHTFGRKTPEFLLLKVDLAEDEAS